MLTSSRMTQIITFFVRWVRDASLFIRPRVIMTDRDQAQITALQTIYPQSQLFLCGWHVLRTIRSHFVTTQFPALWEKIKKWVITENLTKFLNLWDDIWRDPSTPQSLVNYLEKE